MSFVMNENAGGAGRRRVSQVSNDEWRAALQQQIDEKKARDEQQKRHRRFDDDCVETAAHQRASSHPNDTRAFADASSSNGADALGYETLSAAPDPSLRAGRRSVQHMSNDAWREALEQQIREKKAQTESDTARRRSQSAPGQPPDERVSGFPEPQERAMTTPAMNRGSDAAVPGRRRANVQSDAEHSRSLQEQLEVQQRFEQEALEFKRAQRRQRRKLLDDEGDGDASAPASDSSAPKSEDAPDVTVNSESSFESTSNQSESEQKPRDARCSALDEPQAADPAALAKIVDFCEELKRQNEEVKQQLVAQHSVLASLRSSLIAPPKDEKQTPADEKASAKLSKCATPVDTKSRRTSGSERGREADAKTQEAPTLRARPLFRGDSKIPSPAVGAASRPRLSVSDAKQIAGVARAEAKAAAAAPKEKPPDPSLEVSSDAEAHEPPEDERTRSEDAMADAKDERCDDDNQRSLAKSSGDEHGVDESAEREIAHSASFVELPLGGESEFVRCEDACSEEIAGRSAFVLVDNARSSLVPLDQPLGELFERR